MTARIRTLLLLASTTILLAACGTAAGAPAAPATPATPAPATPAAEPSEPVAPSVKPSQTPAESPAEDVVAEREVDGTITVAEGMIFSGPGGTIQEVLDIGPTGEYPTLVNGVIFRDADGRIYLATSVSDASVPTFDRPMLEVLGMDNTGESWDMANAELLGLEEADGIVFNRNAQVLGFLEVND